MAVTGRSVQKYMRGLSMYRTGDLRFDKGTNGFGDINSAKQHGRYIEQVFAKAKQEGRTQ